MKKEGSTAETETEDILGKGFHISGLFKRLRRDRDDGLSNNVPEDAREMPHIYDSSESKPIAEQTNDTGKEMNEEYDFTSESAGQEEIGEVAKTNDEILHYDAVSTVLEEPPEFSPYEFGDTSSENGTTNELADTEFKTENPHAIEPYEEPSSAISELIDQFEGNQILEDALMETDESQFRVDDEEPTLSIPATDETEMVSPKHDMDEVSDLAAVKDDNDPDFVSIDDEAESIDEALNSDQNPDRLNVITKDDLRGVKTKKKLLRKLKSKNIVTKRIVKILGSDENARSYAEELRSLQIELLKLERWVRDHKERVIVLFEGLDPIENRIVISQFTEHLNPDSFRVERFSKRSKKEKKEWYFQRYADHLPKKGEILFLAGGWYDRAIIEPVNGDCNAEEYGQFLKHVLEFESMVAESGIRIVKLWFSISKNEQRKRYKKRKNDETLRQELTRFDKKANKKWSEYKHYRELMFRTTHSDHVPWVCVNANKRKTARLESVKYFLSLFEYEGKDNAVTSLIPDPKVVKRAIG